MKPMLLVCAAVLGGCSSADDTYRFPPTLSELRAELGAPARGTMRIRDYDRNVEYTSDAAFRVKYDSLSCSFVVRYEMIDQDGDRIPASLGFGSSQGCDLEEKLSAGPYPTARGYAGSTRMRGEYLLENASTISGVFYVEMKPSSTGLLPLARAASPLRSPPSA